MKLWDSQHHFQSWVLQVSEEGTAKLSVQNPCLLFKAYSSWWTNTLIQQDRKVRLITQNPRWSGQNWLFDKHQSSYHLMLDILKPATGATCRLSSFLPSDSFRIALSIRPWARAWGREDAAGPQRITAPIAAPCHTQILTLIIVRELALFPHQQVAINISFSTKDTVKGKHGLGLSILLFSYRLI